MSRPIIVEVLRRSEQGKSAPFLCRADDGYSYFVKGLHAGRESQIKEWLCGRLAETLGLPIAPFSLVDVPQELLDARLQPEARSLGLGPAFGSRLVEPVEWFNLGHRRRVAETLQRDVLAFDWWVRNADRTLSERGGNPNLLWDLGQDRLVVIDHNLSFDPDFNIADFFGLHVFSAAASGLVGDLWRREEMSERLMKALEVWPQAVRELPPEWRYSDPEQTLPCRFEPDAALDCLRRASREDFWSTQS